MSKFYSILMDCSCLLSEARCAAHWNIEKWILVCFTASMSRQSLFRHRHRMEEVVSHSFPLIPWILTGLSHRFCFISLEAPDRLKSLITIQTTKTVEGYFYVKDHFRTLLNVNAAFKNQKNFQKYRSDWRHSMLYFSILVWFSYIITINVSSKWQYADYAAFG